MELMAEMADDGARRRTTVLRRTLQRKLELLGCRVLPVAVDEAWELSWMQCAAIVMWLEDRVIRHDPIEGRHALRQASTPATWVEAVTLYLQRVGCPVVVASIQEACEWSDPIRDNDGILTVLLWLAARAITLEYEEQAEKINNQLRPDRPVSPVTNPTSISTSSLPCSPELMQAVEVLARAVGIKWDTSEGLQPSHLQALREIAASTKPSSDNPIGDEENTEDQSVEMARAIERLRLFYISDLKELQLGVNRVLAKAQEFTANPKTDTSLGKTGF